LRIELAPGELAAVREDDLLYPRRGRLERAGDSDSPALAGDSQDQVAANLRYAQL
jgi:hypothetical protein